MTRICTLAVAVAIASAAAARDDRNDTKSKPTAARTAAARPQIGERAPAPAKTPVLDADAVKSIAGSAMTDEQKLAALHCLQSQHPQAFCWALHNELRHLYAGRDERASMGQCDIILSRSPDDGYILSILSDWKLGEDNVAAAAALEAKAAGYSDLRHLAAACLLKARSLR